MDIINYADEERLDALLISLDFEKASVLPLPGSAQCNGINLAIISKEQSIL